MNPKQAIKLTVDTLVLGIQGSEIRVLLIRRKYDPFKDRWAIPGGFVAYQEDLHQAAARELQEETGLMLDHLKQYHTFGSPNRDPRGRAVSVAYFALVHLDQQSARASSDAAEVNWFHLSELPELAFDHDEIATTGFRAIVGYLRSERKELMEFGLESSELDLLQKELVAHSTI